MNVDKDRYRSLTTAAVLLVAAIAAAVSYIHVVELALRWGQPPIAAYSADTQTTATTGTNGDQTRS